MNIDNLGQSQTLTERMMALAEQALPIYERQRILKAQLEQARAGRPPIDVSQMRTPAVPVELSLKPPILTDQMKIGLGIALGVAVFMFMRKRRKG